MQRASRAVYAQGLERSGAVLTPMFLVVLLHIEDMRAERFTDLIAFFDRDARGVQ
ncbi:hypothetical protein [Ruegeria pomeroyi]|uniref:hypothetical protein n=1 Tax=Ruegeria pomeroyi TaxID=89184 RepID=UPI001F4733E9|nr:hypothetical protein [Ruegeria pomeroyi]